MQVYGGEYVYKHLSLTLFFNINLFIKQRYVLILKYHSHRKLASRRFRDRGGTVRFSHRIVFQKIGSTW